MNNSIISPAIWLLVFIAGLPQLSETVYTPSLPDIAASFLTSEAIVEYTLTIYLCGFAMGTLFWGKISDQLGRKPCIIAGILIFIAGCMGCYFSSSVEMLMISRFVQAFGGSIGSVLSQAVVRDAFQGPALGKAYSAISGALGLFPALGPLCGGLIADMFGWRNIFIFLGVSGLIVIFFVIVTLPETHLQAYRKQLSVWKVLRQLLTDKKVLGMGAIVGAANGILFSYFAEGSFYLIKGLNLSPTYYGLTFVPIGAAAMLGGIFSKKLQNRYSSKEIMDLGLFIVLSATSIFSIIALINHNLWVLSNSGMITITILCQIGISFGIFMITGNALALALVDYKHAIGTASSFFGFFYYSLISLSTFVMGLLHNGMLLPMPLYFFGLGCFMILMRLIYLR